ncbi:MAG: hypothetical protein AB1423_06895 [Pseudomonadota bacterium]
MTRRWLWCLSLLLSTAQAEDRDPFQPPVIRPQCQLPEKADLRQWQLKGTLSDQTHQAAYITGPGGGHYFLQAGEYLPGSEWKAERIGRGKVLFRNTSACEKPLWQLSLTRESTYEE